MKRKTGCSVPLPAGCGAIRQPSPRRFGNHGRTGRLKGRLTASRRSNARCMEGRTSTCSKRGSFKRSDLREAEVAPKLSQSQFCTPIHISDNAAIWWLRG